MEDDGRVAFFCQIFLHDGRKEFVRGEREVETRLRENDVGGSE